MGDPLSDPRAQKLLSADTGEIGTLAAAFHKVAGQAQTSATALRGAQNDATWTGQAADAFRTQLSKLPGDLDNVHQSYGEVAGALDTYESQLGPIQSQFRSLSIQLTDARGSLSSAQGQLSSAKTDLSTATSAPHATSSTPAVVNAHSALQAASGSLGRLQGEVSGLESRGYHLLDEFDTIRGHAHSTVSNAAGIAPSQSWLSGALHSIGNFVEDVGKGIGKSVWDLVSGKAITNFIEHPSWATFGELAKDVAVTASLVAMVAAPFAAPELAEADALAVGADTAAEGAAGAADATATGAGDAAAGDTVASGASTFAQGARTVSNVASKTSTGATIGGGATDTAQGHWKDAGLDAAFLIAPNLGSVPKSLGDVKGVGDNFADVLHVGDRAAETAAGTAEGARDYQLLLKLDINPTGAESLTFPEGLPPVLRTIDPSDGAGLKAAVDQANQAAARASARAMHIGRPVANLFDNLATEPSKDAIKQHLSPEPA
jgi:hypothetical protein